MTDGLISLLITLLCDGTSCYLGYKILGISFNQSFQKQIISLILSLLLALFLFYVLDLNENFLTSLLVIFTWILLNMERVDRMKSIGVFLFVFLGTSTIGISIIFILMLIFKQSFMQFFKDTNIVIVVDSIQVSLLYIIYCLRKKFFVNMYINFDKNQYIIFNLVILAITELISVLQYLDGKLPIIDDTKILLTISILLCLFLLFLAVYQAYLNTNQKLLREKNQLQADFQKMQQMYYETILKQNEDIRKFKHDINGHLQTIRYLNMEENVQDLEEYLQKIEQQTSIDLQTRYTGNKMIDILLVDLCNQANLNGIEVHVDGYLPNQLAIEEFDLTTVCFNLFKNALEATSQVTEKDKRYIDIFIDYVDLSHLVLEVKNGISQKVVIEGNHVRTTKEDVRNHGIGLRNVISTVEKYDGYLNLDSTETEFIAKVFL